MTAPEDEQIPGQTDLLEALARVEEHADEDWKDVAWTVLLGLCTSGSPWTTDDFWHAMRQQHPGITTHEPRALGALIRRLIKQGHAEKTGRFGESVRPEAHRAIVFYYRGRAAA